MSKVGENMDNAKPMPLLLIEDDVAMCRQFIDCADKRTDVSFIGITGHSDEGIKLVKDRLPEGVILDLELNWGKGSGIEFLKELNAAEICFRPIIVVTTRNRSELVHETLHEYGVEWIFCKKQQGYSPEMVINHLLSLRPFLHTEQRSNIPPELRTLETPEETRNRLINRIHTELNTIGISPRFKGSPYIREAIFLLISKAKNDSEMVFHDVAIKFDTRYNNVIRNIQAAIHDSWKNTDAETLETHYKAHVRSSTGVPSPTEFIHYYADKISKTM
jgi:DNA-binding NarL/FixJ family response regulator